MRKSDEVVRDRRYDKFTYTKVKTTTPITSSISIKLAMATDTLLTKVLEVVPNY